jgi:5-methylcytosine-specific restriction endonuclease McrA
MQTRDQKNEASRRWRAEHPGYHKAYRAAHKEALAASDAEYYQRDKDERIARQREYYEQNREKVLAYHVEYHQRKKDDPEYKEKGREVVNRRRARQRGAYKEAVNRRKVRERDEGVCGICGQPTDSDDWHLDHIVPLGPGEHSYANVRVTHPRCNEAKGTEDKRVLREWMASK